MPDVAAVMRGLWTEWWPNAEPAALNLYTLMRQTAEAMIKSYDTWAISHHQIYHTKDS